MDGWMDGWIDQMFAFSYICINIFIQKRCIKLIKSNNKDFDIVTKAFY